MDQKPLNSKDRTVRRMDGLGASAKRSQPGAPLDLRRAASGGPKPVEAIKVVPPKSRPATATAPPSSSQLPDRRKNQFDDPLHGLLDDSLDIQPNSTPAQPAQSVPAPRKKKRSWRPFWRFIGVVLILLFIISASMFVYLNYFSGQ